jgi:hypothetical protein
MDFVNSRYRKAEHTHFLSCIGAFAMADYSTNFTITQIAPCLADDVNFPETSELPSLRAVVETWKWMHESNLFDRVAALSKAAVAGVVRPPTDDSKMQDPDTWSRQLEDQESRCEARFKAQCVKGSLLPIGDDASYHTLTTEILNRTEEEKEATSDTWTALRLQQHENLNSHPSLLRAWSDQGAKKFQKLFRDTRT